jgi:outer membrane protein
VPGSNAVTFPPGFGKKRLVDDGLRAWRPIVKNRGRRSRKFGTVAVATALGLVTGTGPASVAFAQGNGKKGGAPTAKEAADAGTRVPDAPSDARRVGLRDALKLAVRQNPTLASETIDVAIADAQIKQTYGLDDWLLDAGATWTSTRNDNLASQVFQQLSTNGLDVNAQIRKPLSDGGVVGVKLNGSGNRTHNKGLIDKDGAGPGLPEIGEYNTDTYSTVAQVTFLQPLLRGFGEDNRNATRIRARAALDVQELERENTAGNVVRDVIQAYWELAYAAQEVEIRKQSLALAREQLRITQAGIDVGKLAKTESLAIEQAIASREEELLLAEQNRSERAIELRRLIGMEIGPGEIELQATDRLDTVGTEPDMDKTLTAAMQNNPQLRTVRAQGKSAQIEVHVADNGLLPELNFNAAAGPAGQAEKLGDAFSNMAEFNSFAVVAGVNFSASLGNHNAKGARAVAEGNLRKVKMTEQDISSQIAAQVVRAVNLVRSAKKRMDVSAKATQLAAQNVDLEKARWEVGRTTNFEVLKRQDELAQSQLREARAHADYLKAVSILDSLTGDILPRYGIELAKQ